jgi:hypothetical protein
MKALTYSLNRGTLFAILLSCVMFWSCGSENTNQEATENQTIAGELQDTAQFKAEAQKIIDEFPSPFAVTELINKAGAGYIIDISNSVDNASKYITVPSRALNLGIYGADLSYAVTYNKKQETMNYLKASQTLLSSLEIKTNYDENFRKKVDANITQKDTLKNMFAGQFSLTYNELNKADRTNISAMMIAGATVEGIYLAAQLTDMASNKTELKKTLTQQKESVSKLVALLKLYKNDSDVQAITPKIEELKVVFDSIGETITDDQLKTLSAKVEEIRKEWIK